MSEDAKIRLGMLAVALTIVGYIAYLIFFVGIVLR
jgi:hypothetical protein